MSSPNLEHEPRLVRSFDGTYIALRDMGQGDKTPLLVSNSIGANLAIWRRTLLPLAAERRIITWDHRGLYESTGPASERVDPGAHAEDAVAVLDDAGIERVAIAAWATGARVALEIAHRYPERVQSLALVCSVAGYSVTRAVLGLEFGSLLPVAAGVAKHFANALEGPFRRLTSRPEMAGIIRQSGLIAATADTGALVQFFRGMASCDTKTLLSSYEAVANDAPGDILDDITMPVLLVAGNKDTFAPLSTQRRLAEGIRGARLEVYDNASHYLPIEHPKRLSEDLASFLAPLDASRP